MPRACSRPAVDHPGVGEMAEPSAACPARHKSVRYLILRLLVVALALLALQGLIYYRHYRMTRERALQANLELARAVASALHDMITAIHRMEAVVGYALTFGEGMTHAQQMQFLRQASEEFPAVRAVAWVGPEGRIVAASDGKVVGKDVGGDLWFRELAAGEEGVVSDTRRARDPEREYFLAARGIRNKQGELLGIVAAEIKTSAIDDWIALKRIPGGSFHLVDRTGWLIYRSDKGPSLPKDRDWARTRPLLREALRGREAVGEQSADGHGRELAANAPVPRVGWVAEASLRDREWQEDLWSSALTDLAVAILILLIAAVAAVHAVRRITGPLANLRQHAAELKNGNLAHRCEEPDTAELAEVAKALNAMTEVAQEREKEQQLRIEAERERTRLAEQVTEEVSHHIRNTLAMITGLLHMQTVFHRDPKTEELLRESIARIRTFANVHEMIYATRAPQVDLLEALRRVATDTAQVLHPQDAITTSVEGEHLSYPSRVVTNLAVAVTELLSNAVRYGAPGADGRQRIDVHVSREEGNLLLSVANTGPQVAEDFDPRQRPTMGLQLVQDLIVSRYGGSFTLRPTSEGSVAEIRVRESELLEKA